MPRNIPHEDVRVTGTVPNTRNGPLAAPKDFVTMHPGGFSDLPEESSFSATASPDLFQGTAAGPDQGLDQEVVVHSHGTGLGQAFLMICSSLGTEGQPLHPASPWWLFPAKEPQSERWNMVRPWHWPPLPRHIHWSSETSSETGFLAVWLHCAQLHYHSSNWGWCALLWATKLRREQLALWVIYFMSEYSKHQCKFLQSVDRAGFQFAEADLMLFAG